MNRLFLNIPALIVTSLLLLSACKKKHALNDYPQNYRIFNLTLTSTDTNVTISNYRFVYGTGNRVNEIYFTTNDPLTPNTISTFKYSNDTIYDTTKFVNNALISIDTFLTDNRGYITATYINGVRTGYSYYIDLLTRIDYSPVLYNEYTSYNGNITQGIPAGTGAATETYKYYTDQKNRSGDYLQLISMVRYGTNFYYNKNLINSIEKPGESVNVTYQIDADSKITRTTATINSLMRSRVDVYDIQYEKF